MGDNTLFELTTALGQDGDKRRSQRPPLNALLHEESKRDTAVTKLSGEMMISQLYVISNNGNTLVTKKYRHDIEVNAADLFKQKLLETEGEPLLPCFEVQGVKLYNILRPPGLYLVSASPTGSSTEKASSVLMIEQLERIYQLLKDFCGMVTEQSLRANMALVHEILDECMDHGYMQLCVTERLKPYIQSEPAVLTSPENLSPGLFGIEHRAVPSEASSRPVILPRSQQEQRKNEIFVDVIEKISALLAANGQVIRCEVHGEIRMKSFLVGSAHIKMGLNDTLTVGRAQAQRGYGHIVHLDECNFHSSVGLGEFDSARILAITPPEGEFSVMKYSVSGDLPHSLPIRVFSYVRDSESPRDIEVGVQLRCETSASCSAIQVTVHLPVPKSTTSITQNLSGPGQTAELSTTDKKIAWKIKKIPGKTEVSAHFKLIGAKEGGSAGSKQLGPVAVDFEVSGFVCSQLQVRFLRVFDREHSYVPLRWLRYISTADSYVVKLH